MPQAIDTGILYCGDNLDRLRELPSESVDLIYLDPPFFSNRIYEVIWGEEAEVRSFADRWEGGVRVYVAWMRKRIMELRRVLKPTGSLYLHCDPHASHYLKVMLDEVFGGTSCFRNEIVWKRTFAKGSPMGRLPANHDLILNYVKSDTEAKWFPPLQAYDLTDLDEKTSKKYSHIDSDGRRYQLTSLLHPEQGRRPNLDYELMGVRRTWRWSRERMEAAVRAGLVVQPRPGAVPRQKRYLDEQPGRYIDDVWTDISALNSQAAERRGFPTQKPESLLARIINSASASGDVVLDPFCGCGTTISAAQKLGRQWIGIDISLTAMRVIENRIKSIPGAFAPRVVGLPENVSQLRQLQPFEFQNWVIQHFFGVASPRKSGDMGIDGYTFFSRDPIQVKRSDRVGRNVVDNFETAVRRDGSSVGWIVAFSFTKDAREEAARATGYRHRNSVVCAP